MYTVKWTQKLSGECEMDFSTEQMALDFLDCLHETCNPRMEKI